MNITILNSLTWRQQINRKQKEGKYRPLGDASTQLAAVKVELSEGFSFLYMSW